jgi:hypothetical protein
MTIRRLMAAIALVAVLTTVGERTWRRYREQHAARARLLAKQRLIRMLGPSAVPQGAGEQIRLRR